MTIRAAELEAAIARIEGQRSLLGDTATDLALGALRAALADATHAQAALSADTPTLRHITILFADIVGSTSTGQLLDTEDFHRLMDTGLRRFTTVIEAAGGEVLKYLGDGLLAAFGLSHSHEVDAENAVNAGLGIIEAAHLVRRQLGDPRGIGFDVRVGIDSGMVIAGGSVEGDHAIRGHAVNLAARMEQSAPTGGLRISAATSALVRGRFVTIEDHNTEIKGVATPVTTHLVVRRRPGGSPSLGRFGAADGPALVGRDAELDQLHASLRRAAEDHRVHSVLVVGDAGIGKSSLADAFIAGLPHGSECPELFVGRCDVRSVHRPYAVLHAVVAAHCGLDRSDPIEVVRRTLVERLAPHFDGVVAPVHLLGHLIGIDFSNSPEVDGIIADASQVRSRGLAAFAHLLRAAGSEAPTVLLLDDVQWADQASLDAISELATLDDGYGLLIVALARPDLHEHRPGWWPIDERSVEIPLGPLTDDGIDQLIEAMVPGLGVAPPAMRAALERADGNPYFVEELVRMLRDNGILVEQSDGVWRADPTRLDRFQVPATLIAVLQARVDALGPAERGALRQASVIGYLFWDQALAALEPASVAQLVPLRSHGLVLDRSASSIEGAAELQFRHHLLHQFAYDTLLKTERARYHARAAGWLQQLAVATGIDLPGVTGDHFERAGMAGPAAECFARAAADAVARAASASAIEFADRGLALVDDDEVRWRLLSSLELALSTIGNHERQADVIVEMERVATEGRNDGQLAEVAAWRISLWQRTGEFERLCQATESYELIDRAGTPETQSVAHNIRSLAFRQLDRLPEARAASDIAVERARHSGSPHRLVMALSGLGCVVREQGDLVGAQHVTDEAIARSREIDDQFGLADALVCTSAIACELGRYADAANAAAEGYRLATALGWRFVQSTALMSLAAALFPSGDIEGALAAATSTVDIAERWGYDDVGAAGLLFTGLSRFRLGDTNAARLMLEESRAINRRLGLVNGVIERVAWLGELEWSAGDAVAATAHVEEALGFIAAHCADAVVPGIFEPLRPAFIIWQLMVAMDDRRARGWLDATRNALLARAELISDAELRAGYLENIDIHRRLIEAWEASPHRSVARP